MVPVVSQQGSHDRQYNCPAFFYIYICKKYKTMNYIYNFGVHVAQGIIHGLDNEKLIKVAKEGFKSRPLVLKDLVEQMKDSTETEQHTSHTSEVPFCICGYCQEMPPDKERVCCKQRHLWRSRTSAFQNICLDSDNLAIAIRSLADTYIFTPIYDNRAMRHAAYRQYIMWIHGHLGKGHQKVIPSCCIWKVRKHYPSPNGPYTGFKDR